MQSLVHPILCFWLTHHACKPSALHLSAQYFAISFPSMELVSLKQDLICLVTSQPQEYWTIEYSHMISNLNRGLAKVGLLLIMNNQNFDWMEQNHYSFFLSDLKGVVMKINNFEFCYLPATVLATQVFSVLIISVSDTGLSRMKLRTFVARKTIRGDDGIAVVVGLWLLVMVQILKRFEKAVFSFANIYHPLWSAAADRDYTSTHLKEIHYSLWL